MIEELKDNKTMRFLLGFSIGLLISLTLIVLVIIIG